MSGDGHKVLEQSYRQQMEVEVDTMARCWLAEAKGREVSGLSTTTTLCIKAFERPRCLNRLLASIRQHRPDLPVIVADDGRKPFRHVDTAGIVCLPLPYDVGLSAGRNALVAACETPLFVLLDDDMSFTHDTDLGALAEPVLDGRFDLVGGAIQFGSVRRQFAGNIRQDGDVLYCDSLGAVDSLTPCDVTWNFFAARTEAIRPVGWDPELKLGEHLDFFQRCQEAGVRVAYHPGVCIDHQEYQDSGYLAGKHRRAAKNKARWMGKRGIRHIEGALTRR
jgi:hypothetical protein